MEASKTAISDKQHASLQELATRADGLHSRIDSGMGFKNLMKADIIAVAWNARLMRGVGEEEPKKQHDEEYVKRLEMWVSLYGGDASDANQKIKVMEAVLSFWEDQVGSNIKKEVKRLE
jgi:hypothetical protein